EDRSADYWAHSGRSPRRSRPPCSEPGVPPRARGRAWLFVSDLLAGRRMNGCVSIVDDTTWGSPFEVLYCRFPKWVCHCQLLHMLLLVGRDWLPARHLN